jgi:hypothetical protein
VATPLCRVNMPREISKYMLVKISFDHANFEKLRELSDELRYTEGFEFLAKAVDALEEMLFKAGKIKK